MKLLWMLIILWLGQPVVQADEIEKVAAAARADLEQNDFDSAIAKLEPAAASHPKSSALWRLLGEATLMQADALASQGISATLIVASYRDAADQIGRAIALEKPSAESYALLARAQFQGGQIPESAETAQRAVALEPRNVAHYLMLGGIRYQLYVEDQGNKELLASARATYFQAIEVDPKSTDALNGMAYCDAIAGQDLKAVESYERSLRLEPAQSGVHTTVFQILGKDGDYNDLVELYARLLPDHSESAALHYYRGYALLSNGQLSEAELAFFTAISKDESYAEWVRPQLAQAKLQEAQRFIEDDSKRAEKLTLAALKTDPQNDSVRQMINFLGGKYFTMEDNAGGADFFQKVVEIETENADWWNNYALLARDAERYEDSYGAYKEALRLNPEDPRLLNDTALIQHYHLKKDLAEARRLYKKAIELATAQLEDPFLGDDQRGELEVALEDAQTNLERLDNKGRRRPRGGGR